jgi:hypothetical protein
MRLRPPFLIDDQTRLPHLAATAFFRMAGLRQSLPFLRP